MGLVIPVFRELMLEQEQVGLIVLARPQSNPGLRHVGVRVITRISGEASSLTLPDTPA